MGGGCESKRMQAPCHRRDAWGIYDLRDLGKTTPSDPLVPIHQSQDQSWWI